MQNIEIDFGKITGYIYIVVNHYNPIGMKRVFTYTFSICIIFIIGFFFSSHQTPNIRMLGESEERGESDALESFEWWYAQRALPYDFIPHDGFQKAARYLNTSMKKERIQSMDGINTSGWNSIGPFNIAGRVLALVVDPTNPNIIWAGSASGGLWKSTTGGVGTNAWSYINTGFNALSVSALTLDPTNHNIIYMGTGEISMYYRPLIGTQGARASYGMGILKSTDGGLTWMQTGLIWTFPEITAVQKIVINPENTQTIYAATSEGVYKSSDGGNSWTQSNNILMAMDVVISPNDTSTLFSSHGNMNSSPNPGLYQTTNAGGSWFKLTAGLPATDFGKTALTISLSQPSILYASIVNAATSKAHGLYKSTDNGINWTLVNSTNYLGDLGWYANVVAVHPTNPDTAYSGGIDIYKSTNGGENLNKISSGSVHVDQHAIAFDPTNPRVMYFGTDGGVYKTTNGGQTFIDCNNGLVTTQFYPGFANAFDDSTIAIGGLQDNGTLKYSGSGYWAQILGADGGWCAIDPTNKNIMYFEEQWLALYKSINGGYGANYIVNGLPVGSGNTNFIAPFVIAPSNPSILYAGSKNVYKTTNGGGNWFSTDGQTTLNGTNIACIGVSRTNPDTIIAATGTGALGASPIFEVFSSSNGGQVWTNVTYNLNTSDSLPNRYPTAIEFDPTNSSMAYLTYSGYGTPHVFKTTNMGQNWTNISANLPDIPHQAITIDPEDPINIYVGTDLGVFHSSNSGTNWEEFNIGMPPAMVLDLTISRANGKLRASTFGNGVYERPLVRIPTLELKIPDGDEIWVAGDSESIQWSHKFIDFLKLEFTTDNGSTWNLTADNVPASQHFYLWPLPMVTTTTARVRVSQVGNEQITDSSSNPFSILLNPDVLDEWNLISVHLKVDDPRKTTLYPTAISDAFKYSSSYTQSDSLYNGMGYWLKFNSPQIIPIIGDSITIDTMHVNAGWNMIGSISSKVATNNIIEIPSGIVTSEYFAYKGGYIVSDTIKPRSGYWVKVNTDGLLVLSTNTTQLKYSGDQFFDRTLNTLIISDNDDNQQKLYFTFDGRDLRIEKYELPPLPPKGQFDVRFASQRMLEIAEQGTREYPILISSGKYPVTIRCEMIDVTQAASLIVGGHAVSLSQTGTTEIYNQKSEIKLRLASASSTEIPKEFSLQQNYPNPFNPSTVIQYSLPTNSWVTLKVYDLQGKEVATLINEWQIAGFKAVKWDVMDLTSGIYLCHISANNFTQTIKMLFIK